jgi:hypothetical protein
MTKEQKINAQIAEGCDTNQISDGYHTFGELYEHRITLYIALCRKLEKGRVWRTQKHSDGSVWEGWFVLGIDYKQGEQITYHLPMSIWDDAEFAETVEKAPDYDGHTGGDVLLRISKL